MAQKALPIGSTTPAEVARKQCFAQAISMCAELAGYNLDKQAHADLGIDKARWSRIRAGTEGIKWDQLSDYMDRMGNDVPVLWMMHQRGYDLATIKKRETEYEVRIRELEEALQRQELKNQALTEALRGGN